MYNFIFDGHSEVVDNLYEAVKVWELYRDSSGGGVSDIGNGGIVMLNDNIVAKISYNGKIWNLNEEEIVP